MDIISKKYILPKLTQEETENMNKPILSNKIVLIMKCFAHRPSTTQEVAIRRTSVLNQPWANSSWDHYLENNQYKAGWQSGSSGSMPA
jgi:hypothetical protein